MHNLSSNFRLFLDITKSVFKSVVQSDDNFKFYPRSLSYLIVKYLPWP